MGKKRSFLGFLASLAMIFFTANALAEGYTCPEYKKYTSCNSGYYLNSASVGNACVACSTASNTTSTQACSTSASITNGTRVSSGTQTCAGYYTGSKDGADSTVGAANACEGCSAWGACTYSSYVCNCNSGYHSEGTGAACTCVSDTVTCAAGQYLPANSKTCSTCKAGYKCPSSAATYTPGTSDQGLTACSGTLEYQNLTGQTACKTVDAGYYKTDNTTQTQCPENYRDGSGAANQNACVGNFTKTGAINECTNPSTTYCATVTCGTCTPGTCTYKKNYAGTITSDCTATSCTKPVSAVTAKANAYVSNLTCTACPSGYPNSAGGNIAITQCYSNTKTREWTGKETECDLPTGCATVVCNSCTGTACEYTAYSNSTGTADGTVKSGCSTNNTACPQTVKSVTAAENYWASTTATSCTACSTTNPTYPYSDAGATASSSCYRACTTADVANSSGTVNGKVYASGVSNCTATGCKSTHYLYNNVCNLLPTGGITCPDGSTGLCCDTGYTKTSDTTCTPNTYTVTYSCGDGSGTAPASGYPEYNGSFTPANNTCTRANWQFNGWLVSGTSDIKKPGASFTWQYTANKTFTAQWIQTAGNCQEGEYYDGTTCQSCPSGYTSDLGADADTKCYKASTMACVVPAACPDNSTYCSYQTTTTVECNQYYNGTCEPTGDQYCPIKKLSCSGGYYGTSTSCEKCSSLGDGYWATSAGGTGAESCYAMCTYDCNTELASLTPEHATCSLVDRYLDGGEFYPQKQCELTTTSCSVTSCTCEDGYTFRMPTGTAGDIGSCDPNTYTITLNDNGGTGGAGTVYQKFATGWSLTNFGTTITKVSVPTRDGSNYTFLGYFESQSGGTAIISADGTLPSNTTFTADTTLYAQWSQNNFTCTAGQTYDGKTCPAGSFCPGGSVPAGTQSDTTTGCQRTCPADTGGGVVTSAAGSITNTSCTATRSNYSSTDMHGSADQTCNYSGTAYNATCSINITKCDAGYYRQSESDIVCTSTEIGAYSPANDLVAHLCSALSGADSTVKTATRNASAATECYNTCSAITISNGTRVPVNTKEYYDGTSIPACQHTTSCDDGYSASGEQCVANVYKITLDHDGGTSATSAIYLKYNTGWYSDSAAKTSITTVALPTKEGGFTCFGYKYDNSLVIDETGKLTTDYKLFTSNATITATWEQNATITCAAGTYYTGAGNLCTTCPAGSYCVGITTFQDINKELGRATCADLNGTYTSAVDANDKTLTTTITSEQGAISATACYATNLAYAPSSNLGAGSQTCYYNATTKSYSDNCKSQKILTCIEGHYLASAANTDCTTVGNGYYSPVKSLTRTACPDLDTVEGVITASDTAGSVQECRLGNIWYEPAGGHSGHRRSCYYNTADSTYSYNCENSVVMVCDAGYYDAGTTVNGERDCIPVGNNFYSPEQAFFSDEPAKPNQGEQAGSSTKRYECPDGGLTSTTTASRNTACYQTCADITITNGKGIAAVASVQYDGTKYAACTYTAQCNEGYSAVNGTTATTTPACEQCGDGYYCPSGDGESGGEKQKCPDGYPHSAENPKTINDCYKECDLAANATQMSGIEYYQGTNSCAIVRCESNYQLSAGKCVICPEGKVCDGTDKEPEDCPEDHYCPSGTDEPVACPTEYPNSSVGTTKEADCYRACTVQDITGATTVSGTLTKGGTNTCVATSCEAGTYLENGKCVKCPAGMTCTGGTTEPKPCEEGYYCPEGGDTPQACPASHPLSTATAASESDCYTTCEEYKIEGGTATPVEAKAFYPGKCEYKGVSDTGNPCDIVNNVCIESSCNSNYELINGRCQLCSRENALSYKPEGNCVIASCVIGYHPNGLVCEEDIRECDMPNATYAEQTWDTKLGAFGICTIKECEDGYHLASNACVLDEQACVVENGTGIKEWNHSTNTWGQCVATSCDPGYTDDPSETNERTKPCGQCKNKFSVLGELAASSYVRGCEIASCMYQGELYNLENNECVPICDVNGYEDETGYEKWDASRKKCVRTCKEGYTMW